MIGTANPGCRAPVCSVFAIMLVVAAAAGPDPVPAEQAASRVTIIQEGVAQLPVIAGSVQEPVAELRHYLRQITGVEFAQQQAEPNKPGIYVGLASDFPWIDVDRVEQLGPEGFVLRTDEQSLYILAAHPRGVQHGVTTWLHRLGCRWYFPGQAWEVVPQRQTISVQYDERQRPAFATQRRIWYGYGAYADGRRDLAEWERHNRMGGPIDVSIGHSWHGLDPEKDFGEHPDWFALVDNQRQPSKPCYSHPQVLQRAIDSALQQAESGTTMISMSPPDGLGFCECPRCLAVLDGGERFRSHSTLFARRPNGQVVNVTSETLFAFVNQVAAAVAQKHAQTLIGCYAYSAYSQPPSFALHPNVYLQATTQFRRTPITLEQQIREFGQKTSQVGIREYYSAYQWDWDYPHPGNVAPAQLAESLTFYHRNGITAVNAEASNNWAARGLGYYVASQLMWNVNADVKALVEDFYENAFGPAAIPMQRYYVRWYGQDVNVLRDEQGAPETRVLYDEGRLDIEALRAACADLDRAVALVAADSPYRRRIDLLRMYVYYLFLRYRLHQAEQAGDPRRIVDAIRDETIFGGRLASTHMIHSRALIGKAFLRRFAKHRSLLDNIEQAQQVGQGWRQLGNPPTNDELELLWSSTKDKTK